MRATLWFLAVMILPHVAAARALDVAVTVDSLPGDVHDLEAVKRAFSTYGVGIVTGFVQGNRAATPEGILALQAWYAGGHRLGSNTYTYANASVSSAAEFIADVSRNEDVLHHATGEIHSWRLFRFPYLNEGNVATQQTVRHHLASADYRVVPVTIDPADRIWDAAFARCMSRGEHGMAITIQRGMIADTLLQLLWADEAARFIFGRPIKHVLSLHAGGLLAASAVDLLQALSEHRVRFVELDEALQDSAYVDVPPSVTSAPGNLLAQLIAAHGLRNAPVAREHPTGWLSQQCL